MSIGTTSGTSLHVDGVRKHFSSCAGRVDALNDVSFDIDAGEFYSIVGPSGCGKSTLLAIIAGLEPEDTGDITVGEGPVPSYSERVTKGGHRVRPYQNDSTRSASRLGHVAYMPQKDLLLPWRTVIENVALGLELTGTARRIACERASEALARSGLHGFAQSYPAELSGGMRQRVAFLRTILTERDLILLDEPFGALDALTRRSMQEWLLDIWSESGQTVLLITHDVEEAIFLSDRIAVMSPRPGRIIAEHRVSLPRPRSIEMITDKPFVDLKRRLIGDLQTGLNGASHVHE
jgi:ABC-type nitrate/sulfonate/bicarbonate transport system ATPase subunit